MQSYRSAHALIPLNYGNIPYASRAAQRSFANVRAIWRPKLISSTLGGAEKVVEVMTEIRLRTQFDETVAQMFFFSLDRLIRFQFIEPAANDNIHSFINQINLRLSMGQLFGLCVDSNHQIRGLGRPGNFRFIPALASPSERSYLRPSTGCFSQERRPHFNCRLCNSAGSREEPFIPLIGVHIGLDILSLYSFFATARRNRWSGNIVCSIAYHERWTEDRLSLNSNCEQRKREREEERKL